VQYWNIAAYQSCGGGSTCVNSTTQPVNLADTVVQPFSNTLQAGSNLTIQLANDLSGNITQAIFSVTDNTGKTSSKTIPLPSTALFPIVAFQANVVGPDSGAGVAFTQGAGNIVYRAATGELCLEGGLPDRCSKSAGNNTPSAETSNATYGVI